MDTITYAELDSGNFLPTSLDSFRRRQAVQECWRRVDGALVLRPVAYTEDWGLGERRKIAAEILETLQRGGAAFGAFHRGEVVGFALLAGTLFGTESQYLDLVHFYVSEPYRGQGAGRRLFELACGKARGLGAQKLYISAHSARDSMAAYWKLGCTEAAEVHQGHAVSEPCDIQMEYLL